MKYFIVQSISSSILITSILIKTKIEVITLQIIITLSLTLKLGAVPLHQWYYSVIKKETEKS